MHVGLKIEPVGREWQIKIKKLNFNDDGWWILDDEKACRKNM